jgi:hypothetical protein
MRLAEMERKGKERKAEFRIDEGNGEGKFEMIIKFEGRGDGVKPLKAPALSTLITIRALIAGDRR